MGLAMTAGLLAACAAAVPHYYAEAGHAVATYAEVRPGQQPVALTLDVHFLRDGAEDVAAANVARDDVQRVLEQVGGFTLGEGTQAAALSIVIHGTYMPAQRTAGKLLTHDLLYGTWISTPRVDPYRFELSYRTAAGATRIARYDDAMLSTLGEHGRDAGDRGPFPDPDSAFNAIIEDVMLHFLKDLQGSESNPAPLVYLP